MPENTATLADKWIAFYTETSAGIDPTIELPYEDPEMCWSVILELNQRRLTPEQKANLAAGLLETLLSLHGSEYISKVEDLAKSSPDFNYLLGGVWQCLMSDEIWKRVQTVRKETW